MLTIKKHASQNHPKTHGFAFNIEPEEHHRTQPLNLRNKHHFDEGSRGVALENQAGGKLSLGV